MSRRRVTPEELALWRKVARTAERKPSSHTAGVPAPVRPKPVPKKEDAPTLDIFEIGQKARPDARGHDVLPGMTERLSSQPLRMDSKSHARMKRGKLTPEARIDLHGMTMARAQPALAAFILRSQSEGRRLVLVITGKGKQSEDDGPIPQRPGVLRHAVPQWLGMPPLAQAVLQVETAHARHGGGGAYYVYLRRQR